MVTLEKITVINLPIATCFDLASSDEVHPAGNVNSGEAAVAVGGVTWQNLTSEITEFERSTYFQNSMIRGAFKSMKHDHYFRSLTTQPTEMRDVFSFAAPLGSLGRIAGSLVLHRYMQALLHDPADWERYLPS